MHRAIKTDLFADPHHQERSGQLDDLSPDDIERLVMLNRRLEELERSLLQINHDLIPNYVAKATQADDPMGDYEFEVEIAFVLREEDPDWRVDSDNILTRRKHGLSKVGMSIQTFPCDFCEMPPSDASICHEPHCYLFHDLYDHSYGIEMSSLSMKDCARVGGIWVDVIIRQQYFLDVVSGTWSKVLLESPQ